ncbi:MAG: hypothetical protein ABIJ86_11345 [Spirochaetota bacterium]
MKIDEDSQASGRRDKRLCLTTGAESINPEDFNASSHDERLALFMAFQALVLGQFEAWSAGPDPDALRDGISFRQVALWLSDAEFEGFTGEFRALLHRYLDSSPEAGRKMRSISTIIIPGGMEPTGGNCSGKP